MIARGPVITYEFEEPAAQVLLRMRGLLRNLVREITWKLREATDDRAWRYRTEEILFGAFRSHVSPEVLQELLRAGDEGAPRQTEVVALFADIRGFTAKTMRVATDRLAADLSAYLDTAVAVVHRYRGMVDKFMGDGVMPCGAISPTRRTARTRSPRPMSSWSRLRSSRSTDGEPLKIGIGIESGIATLGAEIAVGPDLAANLPNEWRARLGGRSGVRNSRRWRR